MAKKELKIGETFQFGAMTLRCVKATDECSGCIFDMPDKCDKHHMAIGACLGDSRADKTSVIFVKVDDNELEAIPDVKADTVDWEQRRYEIAKEAMTSIMSNSEFYEQVLYEGAEKGQRQIQKNISSAAVIFADALIEELKKKK